MIVQLRLDDRLIHGQVVTTWSKSLDINTIICASDEAAQDKMRSKLIVLASPPGIKAYVKPVDEVIRLLKDPRAEKLKILLITDKPQYAIRLIKALDIKAVNVANFHSKESGNLVHIHSGCTAGENDLKSFIELSESCERVYTQLMPTVEVLNFKELVSKAK